MQWKNWTSGILAALLVTTGPTIAQAQAPTSTPSTNPTGSSAEFWVPVARIDPAKNAKIQITNKAGATLDYLMTTHTNFRQLAAGQSVTLSSLTFPLFININYQSGSDNVDYSVSVDQTTNTLIVEVKPTRGQGDRTLNVDQTGGVYLY